MKSKKDNKAGRADKGGTGKPSAAEASRARRAGASTAKPSFGAVAIDWIKSMVMGLLLFLVIRTLAVQTFTIISGSMEETFLIGDFIVVNKVAYGATIPATRSRLPGYTTPQRGDIVVFKSNHNDPPVSLVKRLIGTPGDTVSMKDGVVLLNGKAQNEPYVKRTKPADATMSDPIMAWQKQHLVSLAATAQYAPQRDTWGPIVVPPDNYFMMGDNRDESYDSRFWGFVEKRDIIGRASIIYFSWAPEPSDPPFMHHVRWKRIGDRLK